MNEIWRTVHLKEYQGLYEVSDLGRVKSLDRWIETEDGRNVFYKGVILIPRKDKYGYLYVHFSKNGHRFTIKVHRLVAFAFPEICGEYFEGAQCNHLNEIKTDNRATNIRFCSAGENVNWGERNNKVSRKMYNGKLSKPVLQYTLDGEFVAEYPSGMEAHRVTGCKQSGINNCCLGKLKTSYGYVWKYKNPPIIGRA